MPIRRPPQTTKRTGWVRCNVQQPESIAGARPAGAAARNHSLGPGHGLAVVGLWLRKAVCTPSCAGQAPQAHPC